MDDDMKKNDDLVVTHGGVTIRNPIDVSECAKLIGLSKGQISNLCRRGVIKNIRRGKWIMVDQHSAMAYEPASTGVPGHRDMLQRRIEWEKAQAAKGLPVNP